MSGELGASMDEVPRPAVEHRIGTDIIDVDRVEALIHRSGERFLRHWFTAAEIAYCQGKAHAAQHFAARLAVKEAVTKVLAMDGDGMARPLPWPWIEVLPGAGPRVRLHGWVAEWAAGAGLESVEISLSHTRAHATAVALARVRRGVPEAPQ